MGIFSKIVFGIGIIGVSVVAWGVIVAIRSVISYFLNRELKGFHNCK